MRAVLDANVVVSALIRPEGPPGQILVALLKEQAFELVVSAATLDELRRTLRFPRVRRYLSMPVAETDLWVEALSAISVIVEGRVTERIVTADPSDDIYLEAAFDGLAEYVVRGDRHLLDIREHEGIRIVKPREFLTLLEHRVGR